MTPKKLFVMDATTVEDKTGAEAVIHATWLS
jgi:hypothetical protein